MLPSLRSIASIDIVKGLPEAKLRCAPGEEAAETDDSGLHMPVAAAASRWPIALSMKGEGNAYCPGPGDGIEVFIGENLPNICGDGCCDRG